MSHLCKIADPEGQLPLHGCGGRAMPLKLSVAADPDDAGVLALVCAIDNPGRKARRVAGQPMNLALGWMETEGLSIVEWRVTVGTTIAACNQGVTSARGFRRLGSPNWAEVREAWIWRRSTRVPITPPPVYSPAPGQGRTWSLVEPAGPEGEASRGRVEFGGANACTGTQGFRGYARHRRSGGRGTLGLGQR